MIADIFRPARNTDLLYACTSIERGIADVGIAPENDRVHVRAVLEGGFFYDITAAWNADVIKAAAASKSVLANTRDVTPDDNGAHVGAILKGRFSDICHAA